MFFLRAKVKWGSRAVLVVLVQSTIVFVYPAEVWSGNPVVYSNLTLPALLLHNEHITVHHILAEALSCIPKDLHPIHAFDQLRTHVNVEVSTAAEWRARVFCLQVSHHPVGDSGSSAFLRYGIARSDALSSLTPHRLRRACA